MPAAFDKCQAEGGRIRTITGPSAAWGLSANEYVHVCFPKGGGPGIRSYTKKKVDVKAKKK